MIDHSSPRWFSTGVPVSATLRGDGRERTALVCLASGFFTFWASSRTMRRQGTLASTALSRVARA